MAGMRKLILVRHGETDGGSSVRYYGAADVDISEEGRKQMRQVARSLGSERIDLVVASPLKRSWKSAAIVSGDRQVRLVAGFREVDFGRWEGFSAEEIEQTDPVRFAEWRAGADNFAYPGGEGRREFRARVCDALQELLLEDAPTVLLVIHKGVIRAIVDALTGESLGDEEPAIGGTITLTRDGEHWFRGTRSSDPEGLASLGAA